MGYDVTLHLIDERAIRDELVPRILGTRTKPIAFEKKPGAKKLFAKLRATLERELDDAARALTEMAIFFSSATLPHLPVRGMALSLWHHAPKKVQSKSPIALGSSPEPLFAEIVKKHRGLHGTFPTVFEENFMTGVFIPAAKIATARRWLDRTLSVLTPGERLDVEEIERVLAAAEKNGLAYWEATDLDVYDAKSALLDEPEPKDVRGSWRVADGPSQIVDRVGDDLFVETWGDRYVRIDLSRVPPKSRREKFDCLVFIDRVAGDWVHVDRRQDQAPARFHPFVRKKTLQSKSIAMAPDWKRRSFVSPFVIGGVLHGVDGDVQHGQRLLEHRGRTLVPVQGLPKRIGETPAGRALTGDGVEVLVWNGFGWEKNGTRWKKTFTLGSKESGAGNATFASEWSSVPAGVASFVYLSDRRVFRAERGQKPRRVAPKIENVMRLSAGPSGSILLAMGDNDRAWKVAAIRKDGSVVGLRSQDFAKRGVDAVGIEWSEKAGAIFVVTETGIVAVPRSKLAI